MRMPCSTDRRAKCRGIVGATVLLALACAAPLWAAIPPDGRISFAVLRDGAPMGNHSLAFRQDGNELHVEIDILLEVKLAFITLFRYRHSNHEVWVDGRLAAIETETDDDGDKYWLRGRASDEGFQVEGSNGSFMAPAQIIPTSYWNPATLEQKQLLDTQSGRLVTVAIEPLGEETVAMAGLPVPARRFAMTGDLTLDLWYTARGDWAKIAFNARGTEIDYRRDAPLPGRAAAQVPSKAQ